VSEMKIVNDHCITMYDVARLYTLCLRKKRPPLFSSLTTESISVICVVQYREEISH